MLVTLKNLHQATARQVFDQVKEHLLTQDKRSIIINEDTPYENNNCQYLNSEGLKCAAGCLIAPDEYNEHFEGYTWSDLIRKFNISNNHAVLIRDLQCIHDIYEPRSWPAKLEIFEKDLYKYE